jgi:hypothetical protein
MEIINKFLEAMQVLMLAKVASSAPVRPAEEEE